MNKKRCRELIVYGSLVGLFILGIFIFEHFFNDPVHHPRGKYRPVLNPHPKYFMTVRGNVDPRVHFPLTITSTYYSTNPKCEVVINHFEGVSNAREETVNYRVQRNDSGDFLVKVPLDLYQPGFCKWKIIAVDYALHNLDGVDISFIDTRKKKAGHLKFGKEWLTCDSNACFAAGYKGYLHGEANMYENPVYYLYVKKKL